jgi:hypothetical protein
VKVISAVSLSNSTVLRRLENRSCNIEYGLINYIKKAEGFAMQIDEFTEVASLF